MTAPLHINTLVELHYQPLFHFAARLCGSPETALALTQRTFRKASDCSRFLPVPAQVRQWLFTLLFSEFLRKRAQPRRLRAGGQNEFPLRADSVLRNLTDRITDS